MIRGRKGFGKIVHQSPGPGIRMGLEHAPQLPVRIILRRGKGGCDLLGMMGVIVDDGHAVQYALFLKPAVGAPVSQKAGADIPIVHAQLPGCGKGCQGVIHIVHSRHA